MTEELFWRTRNDSSGLADPRVFVRVFLAPGRLEAAVPFYERIQGVPADGRFSFRTLRLAMVGAFLLIEGSTEDLRPFRDTAGTLLVDDVRPYHDRLVAAGAEIWQPLQPVPTGAGFSARHPDGTSVEYVHHRPRPDGA
ncbi:VOC family protein [Streptomyces hainanensis]|uniref:VOC family protein n=1 Tax=Streptomyces hainanensis TaxID=402648 RepID=A0A4R4TLU9_9ACTN|nr:VOC family protein [Streptomyces hainanensis]TDC76282.1 VOC family protein [Streptomyces hainanensis]